MNVENKSINKKESLKQKNTIYNWRKINSKYILQQIFEHLNQKIYLKIIKYNKNIQNKLDIEHNDYKKYSEIEIEIILAKINCYKKD